MQVIGPFGNSFLMPDDPAANLVMICTGTGSAPMRAMTERRRRLARQGDRGDGGGTLTLFFGARSEGELPYFGPLTSLPRTFIDVNLAYSRMPGADKRYVQDRMRERVDDAGGTGDAPGDAHLRVRTARHGGGRARGARRCGRGGGRRMDGALARAQGQRPAAFRNVLAC